MFEVAKGLILKDRDKARDALRDEIEKSQKNELEAQLDQLEEEARTQALAEAEEAELEKKRQKALVALETAHVDQHEAAEAFDEALMKANKAFENLEALSTKVAQLERDASTGSSQRPSITGHARTGALVAAMWHSARPLSKRLGLRAVPGTAKNIRPLVTVYPKIEKAKQ